MDLRRKVPINLTGLLVATSLLLVAVALSLVLDFQQNATLARIEGGTKRIETTVKPLCSVAGEQAACRELLASQPVRAVRRVCKIAASVLRELGLNAACVIALPRREVVPGSGGNNPGGLGGPPGGGPGGGGGPATQPLVPGAPCTGVGTSLNGQPLTCRK